MTTASTRPSPIAPDETTPAILAAIQGYGYSENEGIARRQQRALALVLQGHFTPKDLTLNVHNLPVVTRFHVRSGSGGGHYYVTRTPNEPGTYDCTCPDIWLPHTCKHRYGAALIQAALTLAHEHRLDLPAYRRILHPSQFSHPFGSHERAALQVMLNTTESYDALAQEAARQFYSAKRSYAAICFSSLMDQARWAYGAGYVGWMERGVGNLESVLAGQPVLPLRWDDEQLRWYVVGEEGGEDTEATHTLLHPNIPAWGRCCEHETEPDPFPAKTGFESEEEPEGHYALP